MNKEGQHSFWRSFPEVSVGWTLVGPTRKRKECLEWIEENWTEMYPKSLVDAMDKRLPS